MVRQSNQRRRPGSAMTETVETRCLNLVPVLPGGQERLQPAALGWTFAIAWLGVRASVA
jgi:hypothetical protein